MYIIVGATGYMGAYLIKEILRQTRERIIAIGRSIIKRTNTNRVKWIHCDVTNPQDINDLKQYIEENCRVIYLSASHHIARVEENPIEAWKTNVIGLENFINMISEFNVDKFIYTSTDCVFGG